MPVTLKVDPWDPGYGGSVEIDDPQDAAPVRVDLKVETETWAPIEPTAQPNEGATRVAFIDGVRRIDHRLFAEQDGLVAPGIAGSWAVGAAWNSRPPRIDHEWVGRDVILGAGLAHPDLDVPIGGALFRYESSSVADATVMGPQQALQTRMREAEGWLARTLFEEGAADLLVLDGPLAYYAANGPVLGFIKRQNRMYLPPEEARIFGQLRRGMRTPIFSTGDRGKERYSWYIRMANGRAIDGVMTGIVRSEVSSEVGIDAAVRLANLAARLFPTFASDGARDPRAPQNLYPVGQLEAHLRHRLGDPELVRRGLDTALARAGQLT